MMRVKHINSLTSNVKHELGNYLTFFLTSPLTRLKIAEVINVFLSIFCENSFLLSLKFFKASLLVSLERCVVITVYIYIFYLIPFFKSPLYIDSQILRILSPTSPVAEQTLLMRNLFQADGVLLLKSSTMLILVTFSKLITKSLKSTSEIFFCLLNGVSSLLS